MRQAAEWLVLLWQGRSSAMAERYSPAHAAMTRRWGGCCGMHLQTCSSCPTDLCRDLWDPKGRLLQMCNYFLEVW